MKQLTDDMHRYLAERNEAPRRYIWKADGHEILRKIARAREALAKVTQMMDNSETAD